MCAMQGQKLTHGTNRIYHRSPLQTENYQQEGKW